MSLTPIKVLHLVPSLASGGAERQLVNIIHNTSREIINHVVCVIEETGYYAMQVREAGYKVVELEIFSKHPFLKAASKFRKVVREEKPDIIHSWLYDAHISARLAVLNGKIPIVTSLQLANYEPEARRIGNWNPHKVHLLRIIDKVTAIATKPYFVPCSKFVEISYQRHYGLNKDRTQVIYNSVDPDSLTASADDVQEIRKELSLPSDAFTYLNVGRLDPQKNHRVLFEAFRLVLSEIPNAYLLLVGIGGRENELKKFVGDLGLDKKILFLGKRDNVGAFLKLADVFVFPSFFEGLPVALIEAMFKSLPCITSRIEVFREVITDGETGILIDPTSSVELKNAMIKLYKNKDLRKSLGENAFRHVKAEFNAVATAKQWESFYQKVKFN